MGKFVAVDTGGTFTDLVAFDPASVPPIRFTKDLTTSKDPVEGINACLDRVNLSLDDAVLFKHGTTLVINALLERAGAKVALLTTKGFRDLLALGRGNRAQPFDLFYARHPELVARSLRYEVTERVDARGKCIAAPQYEEVVRIAEQLQANGVESVAVSFINAYAEPKHERMVAEWLKGLLPHVYVSTGSELSREWYEFERTATAVANAYVGPLVGPYVSSLDAKLKLRDFSGHFYMMGSSGGVLAPTHAAAAPVLLVESGPVGGCIGASLYSRALGLDKVIAFDMGGTTAKCALVEDGMFDVQSLYYVGGYGRGTPLRAPVVEIVEVGAGGGSIAWLDDQNRLRVGPKSAGSNPGPVAYGRGGENPTVTDANLILGRIDPASFQGGDMRLDVAGARRAIASQVAVPLGYEGEAGVIEGARGILLIAAVTMAGAIKSITVEKGHNPRDFALFSYGGGGPLHSVQLARELGIELLVIPPEAGNFSAVGMLLADIRKDEGRTFIADLNNHTLDCADSMFVEMESILKVEFENEFPQAEVTFERRLDLRFIGQFHTVRIPLEPSSRHDDICNIFYKTYLNRYGHVNRHAAIELVSVHVVAQVETPRPSVEAIAAAYTGTAEAKTPGSREVFDIERDHWVTAAVYKRQQLPVGFAANGPAVIEEYGSTTVIGPDDTFEVGKLGELRISVSINEEYRGA